MEAISEFLTSLPRRADGKRTWPRELKAPVVAEKLIEGETVVSVAPIASVCMRNTGRLNAVQRGLRTGQQRKRSFFGNEEYRLSFGQIPLVLYPMNFGCV